MAVGSFDVVLTDRARADYNGIRDAAVAGIDGKTNEAPLLHFHRARSILRSLKDPGAVRLDQPMINNLSWMLSRSEGSTYVYYGRNVYTSTVVVIHLCQGTTDIYLLLAEIVFSGKTEILTALGIIPPPISCARSITIQ
jgi:hypothetical protein